MKLGDTFASYEELVAALDSYSKREYVSFWKRDARTISAARKKTERFIDSKLKYYQLKYTCIKGGRNFKSAGKGKKVSSTYKSGCDAHIMLRASMCGTKLQIISIKTEHNHTISKVTFGSRYLY
ncbi:hypothetical protein RI129_004014 [Pyrocoelia pectoralis]|uniref:ZSWIM3 N-terminal domain-containing protein n=1 Tax=Pyrocoelia pectoralis TaxID=417401 RepID=A0AAN7VIT7_9COLE